MGRGAAGGGRGASRKPAISWRSWGRSRALAARGDAVVDRPRQRTPSNRYLARFQLTSDLDPAVVLGFVYLSSSAVRVVIIRV